MKVKVKSEEQLRSRAYLDGYDDGFEEGIYTYEKDRCRFQVAEPEPALPPQHRLRWFVAGYAVAIVVVSLAQRWL